MPPTADYEFIRHRGNKPGEPPSFATLGRCFDARGEGIMTLLERPWVDADRDGRRDPLTSRFVAGLYRCFLRISHLHGGDGHHADDVWQFEDVPDLAAGQIHAANFPWELEGCVATGTAFGYVQYTGKTITDGTHPREHGVTYPGVTGSRNAFEKFMKDSLALCAREKRDPPHIWIQVTDRFEETIV